MSRAMVAVERERERQESIWGQQDHIPTDYFAILAEEFGEVAKNVVEWRFARTVGARRDRLKLLRTELVQVAAVAVAMVEAIDRAPGGDEC